MAGAGEKESGYPVADFDYLMGELIRYPHLFLNKKSLFYRPIT
jgi:hypothetical protein